MATTPTPAPISAVEAMTPAFERTKQQLFQPFQFWRWSRLAVISLLAGELGGGGGGGGGPHGNWNIPAARQGRHDLVSLAAGPWGDWHTWLPVIVALVLFVMILGIMFMYISSVFRFILFDSVLRERVRIREGWRRWQECGGRFFLWQIGFSLVMLALLGIVIGLPVLFAWRSGLFHNASEHVGTLVLGGLLLFFLLFFLAIAGAVVGVFAKDFVVPLMALEELSAMEAWRRLLPMLKAEKTPYAGYIGMKILLAIAAGILFGILTLIVMLIVLVPLGIVGVAIVAAAAAMGFTWNPLTIALAVLAGAAALFGLFWIAALVSVPSVVFFQSYTLYFFGARYGRLGTILTPPAPPAPPLAAAPVPA